MMRKPILILAFCLCCFSAISAQHANLQKMDSIQRNKYLKEVAFNIAKTFGPDYVPLFKNVTISGIQKFKSGNGEYIRPEEKKYIGRAYYKVTFFEDSIKKWYQYQYDPAKPDDTPKKMERETYAARVKIWADNGEPLSVDYQSGWGYTFLKKSYLEQTGKQPTDSSDGCPKKITTVPLPPKAQDGELICY